MLAAAILRRLSRCRPSANVHVGADAVTLRTSASRKDRGRALRAAQPFGERCMALPAAGDIGRIVGFSGSTLEWNDNRRSKWDHANS
jgi:hypothetical protein